MSIFSRVQEQMRRAWAWWSDVQDREDAVWRETIGEASDRVTTEDDAKGCGTKVDETPSLQALVEQRNRETKSSG